MSEKNTVGEQAAKSFVTMFFGCFGCCGGCIGVIILMMVIGRLG